MTTVSEIMQAIADLSYAEQRIVYKSMQQLMTNGAPQQEVAHPVDFAVLRGKAMHLYDGTDAQLQVTALRREWDV